MSNILVFLQQQEGKVIKASLCALSAALEIKKAWNKDSVLGVCIGSQASKAAEEVLEYGLSSVFFSEDGIFEKYLALTYGMFLKNLFSSKNCDTLVAASTSTGKDLLPRVAALIDAGQASDVIGVNTEGSLKRPMYAGNVFADVELTTTNRVITVRSTAFQPAQKTGSKGNREEFKAGLDDLPFSEVVSYDISKGGRPELSDAEVVVSGGRALQSSENFEKYIFPLADAFGAAVGASRAAVDSGYAPNDWQVGQTGKVVAPQLYVAVGISGAIQHLAGMKDSKVIVAINKDPDAPIFEVADYGLVADLYQTVPVFTELVKKAKAS